MAAPKRRWPWLALAAAAALAGLWRFSIRKNEPSPSTDSSPLGSRFRTGNEYLFHLEALLRPVLEANRREFAGRSGRIVGFGAGRGYPQIWLRDSATLIGTARYHYSLPHLRTWLEEHLAHQQADGQLYDWIAAAPAAPFLAHAPRARLIHRSQNEDGESHIEISADRNTIESDQESAAVLAAHQVFEITGDRDWLTRSIEDRRLIERLEDALSYLLDHRLDSRYGLIVSGFAADWGDVSPVHPDQRAIYLDGSTPRVVGLYTNCQFYEAARRLSEMWAALERSDRARYWQDRAESVGAAINQHLWQTEKGFYRMHRVLTPHLTRGWPDPTDFFAMGGNGLAVLYRIADEAQAQNIFRIARERVRAYNLTTVSGVLLPAFPGGFFKHPMMQEPYQYQNGGQWDWFGGRFVLAEFERGQARLAYRHLVEIARKSGESHGLFEWHTREGRGRGSPYYAGSAGALGEACFRGLFGVYLRASQLDIQVRLEAHPGEIDIIEPATDHRVHYRYHYDTAHRRVIMNYESNLPTHGSLTLLLPDHRTPRKLTIDGIERSYATESIGEDVYLRIATDWSPHQMRLDLN